MFKQLLIDTLNDKNIWNRENGDYLNIKHNNNKYWCSLKGNNVNTIQSKQLGTKQPIEEWLNNLDGKVIIEHKQEASNVDLRALHSKLTDLGDLLDKIDDRIDNMAKQFRILDNRVSKLEGQEEQDQQDLNVFN